MNVSEMWQRNHPWASVYSFGIGRRWLARPTAWVLFGSDIDLLYDATDAIGTLAPGTTLLDVPCGSGVGLRGLRRGQGLHYVAADIAPAMLERTAATAERLGVADQVETVQADVESLQFDDATFDVCTSFTGLHCFPNPRRAIAEIGRVTKPGGVLRASWLRTDAGTRYLPQIAVGRAAGLMGPSATTTEVRTWLAESGFTQIEIVPSGALAYVTAVRA